MPVHLSITCQVSKLTTLDSHQGLIDPTSSSSQCVLSVCIVSSVCVQSVFSVFCVLSVSSVSLLSPQCVLSVSSVCLQCLYCLLSVSSVCPQCVFSVPSVLIMSSLCPVNLWTVLFSVVCLLEDSSCLYTSFSSLLWMDVRLRFSFTLTNSGALRLSSCSFSCCLSSCNTRDTSQDAMMTERRHDGEDVVCVCVCVCVCETSSSFLCLLSSSASRGEIFLWASSSCFLCLISWSLFLDSRTLCSSGFTSKMAPPLDTHTHTHTHRSAGSDIRTQVVTQDRC